MEINANTISLRGESGIVKIVSDSTFAHGSAGAYSDEAECDISIESGGFRVNKAIVLEMPPVLAFLRELKSVIRDRSGTASFLGSKGELSLRLIVKNGEPKVECEMNDRNEGKDNYLQVRYPIESSYFRDLELALEGMLELSPVRGD